MKSQEHKNLSIEFGQRLAHIMKQRNVVSSELSREIGIDNRTLSNWLEGKTLPRLKKVIALAKFFKIKTDYFLGLIDIDDIL